MCFAGWFVFEQEQQRRAAGRKIGAREQGADCVLRFVVVSSCIQNGKQVDASVRAALGLCSPPQISL